MEHRKSDLEPLMLANDPDFDLVMECVFGIQAHEIRTFLALLEAPGSTVTELADDLDRDRSSVNRSLGTLFEKELIERERRLLEGGGYAYQYYPIPIAETKRRMHSSVDEWCQMVHTKIDGFGTQPS